MDNLDAPPSSSSSEHLRWSTPIALGVFVAIVGLTSAVFTAFNGHATGRLLFAAMTLACVAGAAHILRARPRLAVDARGLYVRTAFRRHEWHHGQAKVFVRTTSRFGRDTHLVEIDGLDVHGEETLVLLGRLDLGADPVDVVQAINIVRGSRGHHVENH